MRYHLFLLLLAPSVPAQAEDAADTIPLPVRAMLDAAFASGNEGDVATIARYARAAAPEADAEITRAVVSWREGKAAQREALLRDAGFMDLWRGKAELGGYLTTGNTQNTGLTAALDLTREGLRWRHKLHVQADYQESADVISREHYLVAYEPNFRVAPSSYIYGAAQYEADRFLGYTDRYSLSAGAGYSAIRQQGVTLDLELGPAFRHTDFTDQTTQASLAARGNIDFDWKLSPAITLSQDASAYLQRFNSTVSGTTALNARLFGPLSAQLSYAVQYESMPPAGRRTTDTTSRASLVYSF